MDKFLNRREINKRIIAVPMPGGGFSVKHNIPGEAIVCAVPSLIIAGCIVKALRERQEVKLAERVLAKHMAKKGKGK